MAQTSKCSVKCHLRVEPRVFSFTFATTFENKTLEEPRNRIGKGDETVSSAHPVFLIKIHLIFNTSIATPGYRCVV